MTEVLCRSAGRLRLSLVWCNIPAYRKFARWEGRLGNLVFVRVLVEFCEQPGEELCVQLRGVFVIDGNLRRTESLNQAADEVENLGLIIGFYQPVELGPQELEQERRREGREDEVTIRRIEHEAARSQGFDHDPDHGGGSAETLCVKVS